MWLLQIVNLNTQCKVELFANWLVVLNDRHNYIAHKQYEIISRIPLSKFYMTSLSTKECLVSFCFNLVFLKSLGILINKNIVDAV